MEEGRKEDVMEELSKCGRADIAAAFEISSKLVGSMTSNGCIGPFFERDTYGNLYISMILYGISKPEKGFGMDDFIWKDKIHEMIDESGVGAATRLFQKIMDRFPEIRTKVKMKLEIMGYDAGWLQD